MNLVGNSINGYTFKEALGSGNFGSVYKVSKDNKIYAAKVFSEMYILSEFKKEKNRIVQEINILKNVNDRNLIKYIDDFYFQNEFGISIYVVIMEYFNGITLKDFLMINTDLELLKTVFIEILNGVDALHNTKIKENGIIHRDLKPDNILINENLEIKIIDYGLSKIIDFSSITTTGAFIGSPLYMSPEQLKDSKNIDYRSDIYSLGIILYEMFTQNIPYQAATVEELLLKILSEPIVPPKQYNENIPNSIEKIIYKATAKEKFARFQTIEDFKNEFINSTTNDELQILGNYYAWLLREKDVTIKFEKLNETSVIYPIHLKNWSKGLYDYFGKKNFHNVVIDPSTQRLSYIAFASKKGLMELQYAPKKGVISLDYLKNPINRHNYLKNWYSEVKAGHKLILPYHYISNTDYSVDNIDEWIKINIKLIEDSSKLISNNCEKYAMISVGLNHLVYRAANILSYYINANVDYFIVQVSDLKQLNEQSLRSYFEFMENLQKYTNKPVIALKVPVSLGLTLLAKGIHGFSLGLAGIDYFDEQYIKEEKDAFNTFSRYYFPQLLSFLSYPKKDLYAFKQLYDYFGGCDCYWCKNKDAIEIGKGDKIIQLHFWQKMIEETSEINYIDNDKKILYIKDRIIDALYNFDEIPKQILGSQKNNDYYKLLKNLNKII